MYKLLCVALSALFGLCVCYSEVPPDCVVGCKCLWRGGKKTVECVDKSLIMIPEGIDSETLVLDLSGNNFQILPKETFQRAGVVNVQKMYLRACHLGQIDDNAFRGLTNLIELDLSENLLTFVPSHAFFNIPYLRILNLNKNSIQKVDPFTFQSVPNLIKIDLSFCGLQTIGPKAFEGLDMLEFLKLNDNRLANLPANTVNVLHRLKTLELHGNNWRCDCNLRATRIWLSDYSVHVPSPLFCSGGPERLKGQQLTELGPDDFACKPQIKADIGNVEAVSGSNTTIECRVESDPVARISWYWNGRSLANYSIFGQNQRIFISQTGENIYDMRSRLILTEVEVSDAGQYFCIAENRAGNDEASFNLSVVKAPVKISMFDSSHLNTITVAFGLLVIFMLFVIALLYRKVKRSRNDDDKYVEEPVKPVMANNEKSNVSDTSSTTGQSHDSVYKDSGKAFTITSDLSYSRSFSDMINPQFSNPDLISSAHMHGSTCVTPLPITRPISDYSQNWQRSYDMPRVASSLAFSYDMPPDMPIVLDSVSAGSSSDEVFSNSRVSNDYPPDYGLPILSENGAIQPCAKTLKVWQRGVPVYPPMCQTLQVQHPISRNSPAEPPRTQGCGTDV